MADLEELRRLAWECAQRHGHDVCPITGSDLIDLLDHISAQTQTISEQAAEIERLKTLVEDWADGEMEQTISNLARALEQIADGATWENGASTADENLKRHAFESLKLARAALSSARSEEEE